MDMLLDDGVIKQAYLFPSFSIGKGSERNILTIDEVHQLLDQCKNQLEKNIINIAYGCALRREEMELLNIQDIQLNRGVLIVRNGKGEKRREVPLTNKLVNEFRLYITTYRPQLLKETKQLQPAFFINSKGERMTGDHLNDTLKYIINRASNNEIIEKNITLHCLRHSIATHLTEAGANLEFIQSFLGHCEIDTTLLYMKRRKKQLLIA
jgi:site-specific recombinase XerD